MAKHKVSPATEKNWKRMGVSVRGRLQRGANKLRSERRFLPKEYVTNPINVPIFLRWAEELSERSETLEELLYSIGRALWRQRGIDLGNSFAEGAMREFEQKICEISIPKWEGEEDVLGILYQTLRSEGEKNLYGAYYTPRKIVSEMTKDLDFSAGQSLLDPCLGSGSFLLQSGAAPEQIIGMDIDPIAVMIAIFNFYLHFPKYPGKPSFVRSDFLKTSAEQSFDYIVTNPPWGSSASDKSSEDTFARFFRQSVKWLKQGGEIRFLLPESVLNVRCHETFRRYLLRDLNMMELRFHPAVFDGVMTNFVELRARKEKSIPCFRMISGGKELQVEKKMIENLPNVNFSMLEREDLSLLQKVREKSSHDLSLSRFALGIVTGDNSRHLSRIHGKGMEPILVGRDVSPFCLKQPSHFIRFDRESLQQVAPEEIYRTVPKLIYRFISKRPIFAPDYEGLLCLNSLNVLIPNLPGMSVETVAAFLNSDLYAYLYMMLFGERKILKGNLSQLPFPEISREEDERILKMVHAMNSGVFVDWKRWNGLIYDVFGLDVEERDRIQKRLQMDKKNV